MPAHFARAAAVAGALALAMITAACADDPTGITPPPPTPVASVEVTPPAHSLMIGQQVTLQARPKALNGTELDRTVTWSSDNEALATVSSAGVVTTLAVGAVAIRATSEGRVGRADLTITPVPPAPVAEVRISANDEIQLEWNGATHVSAVPLDAQGNVLENRGAVEWLSSRPSVATVVNGAITAVGPGTAIVSATIEGVISHVGVRVKLAPVTAVTIEGSTGMEIGEVAIFGSRITRANGQVYYEPATWISSAPAIIRVDHQDMWGASLEAVAEGVATITMSKEGVSDELVLRVTPRATHDLTYNRWSGSHSEIFIMDLATDGTIPVKVNAGNVSRDPSPSPDGTQLVFAVSQLLNGDMQHDLYIVNRNGLNMRWLTRMPGVEDQPKWSPDGTKILFRGIVDDVPDLFTINVDGTGLTKLTAALPDDMTDKRDAVWSPNGSRIAFLGARGNSYKIWTINSDGSNPVQITTDVGFDMSPAFSPTGDRIAFTRYNAAKPGNGYDIMIVSSQGGTPARLELAGDQRSPAWSPDGHYIAVTGSAVAGQGQWEIWTLRPDGSGLRLRTVNPAWGGGVGPQWITRP